MAVSAHSRSSATDSTGEGGKDGTGLPQLEVVRAAEEPRAMLNKPIVLDAEGKVEGEKVEKTLLQK